MRKNEFDCFSNKIFNYIKNKSEMHTVRQFNICKSIYIWKYEWWKKQKQKKKNETSTTQWMNTLTIELDSFHCTNLVICASGKCLCEFTVILFFGEMSLVLFRLQTKFDIWLGKKEKQLIYRFQLHVLLRLCEIGCNERWQINSNEFFFSQIISVFNVMKIEQSQ